MAAAIAALTPFEDDDWNTPAPSLQNSPAPTKCCDLPDYDPSTRRNHSRSVDSKKWNTGQYPRQAPPLAESKPAPAPLRLERPKPVRLATPNTGYPFPYVLSQPSTPLDPPSQPTSRDSDDASSSSSESSHRRAQSSSAFSDSSSSSSSPSTPTDEHLPKYESQATTPHEVQERRTKNAASTPGAPPPMGFVGAGHANSFVDFEDVKGARSTASARDEQADDGDAATPKKLANPLLAKLQNLAVSDSTSA